MRRFTHLSYTDRLRIERGVLEGRSKREIAKEIHVHISTIYRELERGVYTHLNTDLTTEERYSPEIAEKKYRDNLAAKGADLKIGADHKLAEHIEHKIVDEKYSPAAVLGEIKRKGIVFSVSISVPTLYSYIDKGIFLRLTNKDLPDKPKKKRGYKKVREKRPPKGESIENRPPEIETRETFGHWEMDSVIGKKKKSKNRLVVLTERKTRKEIGIKVSDGSCASVVDVLNSLEKQYNNLFTRIFQTITVDNGSEFADCAEMEQSCIKEGEKRTKIYYCHPYSSYERGSNEKQNRMIRRYIPKGTNFDEKTQEEIEQIIVWLNNYPRGIFDYGTSEEAYKAELSALITCS